ncbi:MAG: hypothetical protein U1E62_21515 [Alsobacter sp.]
MASAPAPTPEPTRPLNPALVPLIEALARAAARRDYAAALAAQGRLTEKPDANILQPAQSRHLRPILD